VLWVDRDKLAELTMDRPMRFQIQHWPDEQANPNICNTSYPPAIRLVMPPNVFSAIRATAFGIAIHPLHQDNNGKSAATAELAAGSRLSCFA
jgi:hypothetical protein